MHHRDAWTKQKGLSTSEAQSKYVEHFIALLEKNGGEESEKHKAAVSGYRSLLLLGFPANLKSLRQVLAA